MNSKGLFGKHWEGYGEFDDIKMFSTYAVF